MKRLMEMEYQYKNLKVRNFYQSAKQLKSFFKEGQEVSGIKIGWAENRENVERAFQGIAQWKGKSKWGTPRREKYRKEKRVHKQTNQKQRDWRATIWARRKIWKIIKVRGEIVGEIQARNHDFQTIPIYCLHISSKYEIKFYEHYLVKSWVNWECRGNWSDCWKWHGQDINMFNKNILSKIGINVRRSIIISFV